MKRASSGKHKRKGNYFLFLLIMCMTAVFFKCNQRKVERRYTEYTADPDEEKAVLLLSAMQNLLGHHSDTRGDAAKAYTVASAVMTLCRELYERFATLRMKIRYGICCVSFGRMCVCMNRYDEAIEAGERAKTLLEHIEEECARYMTDNLATYTIGELVESRRAVSVLASMYGLLAELDEKEDRPECEKQHRLMRVTLCKWVEKRLKGDPLICLDTVSAQYQLARYYQRIGDTNAAVAVYDEAYPIAVGIGNETGYLYAGELCVLLNMMRAEICLAQGNTKGALHIYTVNVQNLQASKISPPMKKLLIRNYTAIQQICFDAKAYDAALKTAHAGLLVYKEIPDSGHAAYVHEQFGFLAACYEKKGDRKTQAHMQKQALEMRKMMLEKDGSAEGTQTYYREALALAQAYLQSAQWDAALALLEELAVFCKEQTVLGHAYQTLPDVYGFMAQTFDAMKKPHKAKSCLKKNVDLGREYLKNGRSQEAYMALSAAYTAFGVWYENRRKQSAAYRAYKKAMWLLEECAAVYRGEECCKMLAAVCAAMAQLTKKSAHTHWMRALELWEQLAKHDPKNEEYATMCRVIKDKLNRS